MLSLVGIGAHRSLSLLLFDLFGLGFQLECLIQETLCYGLVSLVGFPVAPGGGQHRCPDVSLLSLDASWFDRLWFACVHGHMLARPPN